MPFKSEAELEKLRQDIYNVVWPMLSDVDNKNWTLKNGTDLEETGKVYRGDHPKLGVVWKLQVNIDMSADAYYEEFIKNGKVVGWVPNVEEYEFLEKGQYGEYDWSVSYSKVAKIAAVSSRDFVSFNIHTKMSDGCHLTLVIAVEHPNTPQNKGTVRGVYLPTGVYLRPVSGNPNRCEVHWVNNSDLKGFLPRSLINFVMSSFLLEFSGALIKKARGEI